MKAYLKPIWMITVMAALCATLSAGEGEIIVQEASGIMRLGERLVIVGDDADGRYYELDLGERRDPVIPIDPAKVREVTIPNAALAMDLESIDLLADGRIAVLSEQLRCLIAGKGPGDQPFEVVAEYPRTFAEFGGLGLEGLAVSKRASGNSRIAVLWEGGYPAFELVPEELRDLVGRLPLKPTVIVHEIADDGVADLVRQPPKVIPLQVPVSGGEEPEAQRFRGTDLVWHRWRNPEERGEITEGFIVLLSSSNSPTEGTRRYQFKHLQRFDMEGRPVGDPLDLTSICRTILGESADEVCKGLGFEMSYHMRSVIGIVEESQGESVNWEGLDWFVEGESLITIYDTWPKDPPFALIFDIPEEWK
jgi:hypothetical protein